MPWPRRTQLALVVNTPDIQTLNPNQTATRADVCSGGLSNSGTSAARPPAASIPLLLSLNLPQFILNLSQDIERQARYHETMSIKLYLAPSQA